MKLKNIQLSLRQSLGFAAVALVFGGAAMARPVQAAPQSPYAQMFASVDIQQLLSGYTKKATYDASLQETNQQMTTDLQTESSYTMLDQADQTELGNLLALPKPTDAQTAEISALEEKSNQALQQLQALQQSPNPTAAQTSTMDQLVQQQKDGKKALQAVASADQDQIQQKSDALSLKLSADVKAAIAKVAKQQGLAVVFDSQVAIYTANDITDAVLKVLNK